MIVVAPYLLVKNIKKLKKINRSQRGSFGGKRTTAKSSGGHFITVQILLDPNKHNIPAWPIPVNLE
jgi:hypothetical protein